MITGIGLKIAVFLITVAVAAALIIVWKIAEDKDSMLLAALGAVLGIIMLVLMAWQMVED